MPNLSVAQQNTIEHYEGKGYTCEYDTPNESKMLDVNLTRWDKPAIRVWINHYGHTFFHSSVPHPLPSL